MIAAGLMGRLLHAFVGYEAAPSGLMVVTYALYVLVYGGQFLATVRGGVSQSRLPGG